jgi:hypothetical protein
MFEQKRFAERHLLKFESQKLKLILHSYNYPFFLTQTDFGVGIDLTWLALTEVPNVVSPGGFGSGA